MGKRNPEHKKSIRKSGQKHILKSKMKKNPESSSVIHLRLEYDDAVDSVKDILEIEKSLMILAKKIKDYLYVRKDELKIKSSLSRKSKETKSIMKRMIDNFPQVKTPKVFGKKSFDFDKIEGRSKIDSSIERQIYEIQEKLNSLERRQRY